MAVFDYKAKNKSGDTVNGAVEAPSENVAQEVLRDKGLIVLSVNERSKITLFQSTFGFLKRVPRKDVVMFSRQLAVLIAATVPIVQALRILVKQQKNVNFKIILSEIADEVDGGARLSQTLGKYPQVFSDFFVHMIRSGETTGKLDETLNYLADQQERDYDLMSKIKGAMIYPVFIVGGMIAVGVLMMIFVLPKLTEVLEQGGGELPWSTKLVMGTSGFLQSKWWLLLLIIIILVAVFILIRKNPAGQRKLDELKMRLPVFGQIYQNIYLVRFSRSLATLLVSGVTLTKSLEITGDIVGNLLYKELVEDTIEDVESGKSIATSFLKSKAVPVMLPHMMAIGEQTGKMDLILDKISGFYARELENTVNNLVSLIQPFILVIMGIGVAVMVMSILLPMYNLSQAV
ncbi:MAG: type II secretion system F family protein [Patescibacteria group bacterium]|nr:type II secretion system F family protein [Patescibacteria group bacterium]